MRHGSPTALSTRARLKARAVFSLRRHIRRRPWREPAVPSRARRAGRNSARPEIRAVSSQTNPSMKKLFPGARTLEAPDWRCFIASPKRCFRFLVCVLCLLVGFLFSGLHRLRALLPSIAVLVGPPSAKSRRLLRNVI